METLLLKIDRNEMDVSALEKPADILKNGGLVAFPTETVYGLGANALDSLAIKKIYEAKGRPSDNPLIVHIATFEEMERLVDWVPDMAIKLMDAFWPGPLTMIFKKSGEVPDIATGGLDSVAIRMPSHPIALELIRQSGVPVVAPSANLSGKPSPTDAAHVVKDLMGRVDCIIEGGSCEVGLESTVLDVTGEVPVILRPGRVTAEDIEAVVGSVAVDPAINGDVEFVPKSPGMKYTHYSPEAEVIILTGEEMDVIKQINFMSDNLLKMNKRVGIMTCSENFARYRASVVFSLGSKENMEEIGSNLFDCLRRFDEEAVDIIIAESYEDEGLGQAVMNRLKKAAGYNIIEV